MLVLSRKFDQSIQIGETIKITVLRIGATSVRVGIEAPPELKIFRSELLGQTETVEQCTPQPEAA